MTYGPPSAHIPPTSMTERIPRKSIVVEAATMKPPASSAATARRVGPREGAPEGMAPRTARS